jgi:hypothetical protein
MIELTEDEQRAVDAEATPRLVDPRNKRTYVLLGADVFERFRHLITEDEPDMRQVGSLVEHAMRDDDAGDPTLAFYEQKYGRRP